jgi:hypothetical protein
VAGRWFSPDTPVSSSKKKLSATMLGLWFMVLNVTFSGFDQIADIHIIIYYAWFMVFSEISDWPQVININILLDCNLLFS